MIAGERGRHQMFYSSRGTAARLCCRGSRLGRVPGGLGIGLLAALVGSLITGMGIGAGALARRHSPWSCSVEYGCLALTVGAATGRRAVAIGLPATAAVAAYVLYAAGMLVDAVEPWQPMSPFSQALTGGPVGAGLPLAYVWMAVGAIVFIAASMPIFDRRDIAAH
jgi:ABC-2 type transport system permease protein